MSNLPRRLRWFKFKAKNETSWGKKKCGVFYSVGDDGQNYRGD